MKAGYALAAMALLGPVLLAGCGKTALELPTDTVERAATCGVIAAIEARTTAGVKGNLPADAQARIFQYPLLAASTSGSFDADTSNAVFKRMPALFDSVTKTRWQELKPACAAAYPETQVAQPTLPAAPLDRALQCYMIADFMRKALANQGPSYGEAVMGYRQLTNLLDGKVAAASKAAGIKNGAAVQTRRKAALAAVAKLGQPGPVIAACEAGYD